MKGVCRRVIDDDEETEWWREVRYRSLRYGESKNVPAKSMEIVLKEKVEGNDRVALDEQLSKIMSFPKGSSTERVLKSRVGLGEMESELKLVYVVLPLDKLDLVAVVSNNSGGSKDQRPATSSIESSNGVGTFATWSKTTSFWRGTGVGMSSRA